MWVAKVRLNGEKGSIGKRCKKFNVSISGYPVSTYEKSNSIYIYLVGLIFGDKKSKNKFVKDFNKGEKTQHLERKDDFVIGQIKEDTKLKAMYNHKLIHLKPIIINEKGINFWTIGSWDRRELLRFIQLVEKHYDGELISIEQENIKSFSILNIQPEVTKKQKRAMEIAIKQGYYEYPRKTSVQDLAKISKLSFSTFQAHLRKAEKKLIPFYFEN